MKKFVLCLIMGLFVGLTQCPLEAAPKKAKAVKVASLSDGKFVLYSAGVLVGGWQVVNALGHLCRYVINKPATSSEVDNAWSPGVMLGLGICCAGVALVCAKRLKPAIIQFFQG